MPDGPWSYIIIILLIIMSAFFSATETAYSSVNRIRLKVMADDGNKNAKMACVIADKFDKALITILIGNNFVNIFCSTLVTLIFVNAMQNNPDLASIIATIATTAVIYIFGETIPKSVGRARSEGVALFSAYLIRGLMFLLLPISLIFEGMTWVCKKVFNIKDKPMLTETDFTNIIESIEEEGLLEEEESEIIQSAFDFGETLIKDLLTPKDKMFAINISKLNHSSLNQALNEEKYSRIPIYKNDINNIVGILHVKSYLREYLANPKVSIKSTLSKPYFINGKITIDELFEGFRKHKTHIAIVKDDKDMTLGMVTMEDVLEELVGEISEINFETKKHRGGKK